jgi:IclR family transcriptional regulator, acetate operon repressor
MQRADSPLDGSRTDSYNSDMGKRSLPVRRPDDAERESGRQLVARVTGLLQIVGDHPHGLNMSQIARVAGLPRTTGQRLVAALAAQKFLTIHKSGRVRLGPALARLAAKAHVDVTAVARPHLEALRLSVDETIHLWVATDGEMVLIDRLLCSHDVGIATLLGARHALAANAGGKACLAELPEAEVLRLVAGRLPSMTVHSVVTPEALLRQLDRVRSAGVAFNLEESIPDVCAAGVALHPGVDQQYAICAAAPARRFHDKRENIVRALIACRDEIEEELGTR